MGATEIFQLAKGCRAEATLGGKGTRVMQRRCSRLGEGLRLIVVAGGKGNQFLTSPQTLSNGCGNRVVESAKEVGSGRCVRNQREKGGRDEGGK